MADSEFNTDNYSGARISKRSSKKQGSKKRNHGVWIWLLCIVFVSVFISATVITLGFDYLGIRLGVSGDIAVNIEQGMTGRQIAEVLESEGAINNAFMFRIYSKLKNYESQYKYGVYTFGGELGYDDIAEKLMYEGAKAESVTVTIPERATIDEMAQILETNGICSKSDFRNAVQHEDFNYDFMKDIPVKSVYYRLEGYLFPDTYDFFSYDSKSCARLAVDKMLKTTNERVFTKQNIDRAREMGYSMHELLTMASVVELEASGAPAEMANVAAVFYNRLNWNEAKLLGSSPTAEYPHGNGRYDTNKYEGLPPGPLCSPSLNAVMASLNPTENFEYTYFVTDANMKFYYRSSYNEHIAIIKELKKQGLWIG